jgi:hypothetical protein
MADLHFPQELPLQCIRDLVSAVRAGDYTSAETVDHALYAAGCINALRGPQPFGAEASADAIPQMSDTAVCNAIEAEIPEGYGDGDESESLSPVLVSLIFDLALRVLRRFLDR